MISNKGAKVFFFQLIFTSLKMFSVDNLPYIFVDRKENVAHGTLIAYLRIEYSSPEMKQSNAFNSIQLNEI